MQKEKRSLLPGVDYITILIILIFLAMAFGVFLYYKKRLNTIQHQLMQTGYRFEGMRNIEHPALLWSIDLHLPTH
jgi:hypothetical protein